MNKDELLELKARMENALENDLLEDESFDINEFEEQVCTIEQDLEDYLPAARDAERKLINNILRLITNMSFSMRTRNAGPCSPTERMITNPYTIVNRRPQKYNTTTYICYASSSG